ELHAFVGKRQLLRQVSHRGRTDVAARLSQILKSEPTLTRQTQGQFGDRSPHGTRGSARVEAEASGEVGQLRIPKQLSAREQRRPELSALLGLELRDEQNAWLAWGSGSRFLEGRGLDSKKQRSRRVDRAGPDRTPVERRLRCLRWGSGETSMHPDQQR